MAVVRKRSLLRALLEPEIIPDPHGVVGLALAFGVMTSFLTLSPRAGGHLWSDSLPLEILGHVWLILGPPASVYLGVRHLVVVGDSPFPLVSVPLAAFLTVLTAVGQGVGLFLG